MAPHLIVNVIRPSGGGMRRHLLSLAERLDRSRFRMLVAGPADPWLGPRLAGTGAEFHTLDISPDFAPLADLIAAWRLGRLIRACRPSLLHCHGSKAALVGRLAAGVAPGLPIVYTVHGTSAPNARWQALLVRVAERGLGWRTAAYVAVSAAVAAQVRRDWGVSGPRMRVIHGGIDASGFGGTERAQARRQLDLPAGRPVIGMVGRIGREKGPDLFIHAAAGVAGRYPQAFFVVAGDGPALEGTRRLAASLGLGEAVRFLGERDDIARVLSALDVFVLPSRSEGLSLALLEAMATGLPVVAAAVGGVPEVIREGIDGCLVPPGDHLAMAGRLGDLIADPPLRARLGAAARTTVRRRFHVDLMVRQVEDLYGRALGGRPELTGTAGRAR